MSDYPKCFLIEPLYGDDLPEEPEYSYKEKEWPPHMYITGWKRADGSGLVLPNIREFGIGAMWYATWYPKNMTWENETEPHLIVAAPSNTDWDIDSRCSNCGSPQDNLHRCWVRSGIPPNITVNKGSGKMPETCSAGAGSFYSHDKTWHGFLENGIFRQC